MSEHDKGEATDLSKTKETKPQFEKKSSCPPQGSLNKYITNGM